MSTQGTAGRDREARATIEREASAGVADEPNTDPRSRVDLAADPDDADFPKRAQQIFRQAVVATPVSLLVDAAYVGLLCPTAKWPLIVASRFVLAGMYLLCIRWLDGSSALVAERSMRITGVAQMLFTAIAMHATEGATSLYVVNSVVMGAGFVAVARPRREALSIQFGTLAALPVALALMAPLFPASAATFAGRASLGHFVVLYAVALITGLMSAEMSQLVWSLRREIFESKRVGRYILRKRIGEGGMGEVWSALHQGLSQEVALKFLHVQMRDTTAKRRFEREARATAELRHPNTVRILDAGVTEDGRPFYAMELLSGRSLRELVEEDGPLRPATAVRLVEQAARALGEAHGLGIVHRDVKPENLFVVELDGELAVKVLDFGVACFATASDDERLTATGLLVGTPTTVAPEVVLGHAPEASADVYALGCVLFYALTGSEPYESGSVASVLFAHVNEPIPDLRGRAGPGLHDALVRIVERALAKGPAERFVDGTALGEALRPLRDVAGEPAPRPSFRAEHAETRRVRRSSARTA